MPDSGRVQVPERGCNCQLTPDACARSCPSGEAGLCATPTAGKPGSATATHPSVAHDSVRRAAADPTEIDPQLLAFARILVRGSDQRSSPDENLVLRAVKEALAERGAIPGGNAEGSAPRAAAGGAGHTSRGMNWERLALLAALLCLATISVPLISGMLSSKPSFFRLSRGADEQITGERRLELRRLAKKTSVLVASQHHAGSGFIYRRFGDLVLVVTNAHVVTDDAGQLDGSIRVKSPDGSWQPAYPVWLEEDPGRVDIALLGIVDTPHELGQPAVVGRLGHEGQYVTCSGFPLGEEFVLSSGYVRSNERGGEAFKHDCVAERGSSGGPVFDSSGRVVGVTTYLFMPGTESERAVALDLSHYFSQTRVSTASIDAARGWQPVGLWVNKGTKVSMLAEGEWSYAPWRKSAQSRGVHHPDLTPLAVERDLPYASLICKVGDSTPVSVNKRWAGSGAGSSAVSDFEAQATGELLCRINDSELEDNRGSLTVLGLSRN